PQRVRVLSGRGDDGQPANAEEALESVFVDVLLPDAAARVTDPQTRRDAVVAHFPDAADPLTGEKGQASAELSYVDADGQTVLRVVTTGQAANADDLRRMDLGGYALMVEGRERRRFLTPAMRGQQKALNTASTEMRVVNDEEGFPKRLLLNAMPPGEWVEETDPETGRTRDVFKAAPFALGPGEFAHVTGEEVYDPEATDEAGNPVVTGTKSASATTLEAGNPENYKTEMAVRREAILRAARQLYALLSGDADASGESRVQALYEMMNDAASLKSVLDRVGRHVLTAAWNLACYLAGEPDRMLHALGLRLVFDCRITLPQPTSAQIDSYVKLVEKKIWAPSTAQAATGIDDTEAEDERIEREGRRRLSPVDRAAIERTQVNTEADRRALNPASEATRTAIEGGGTEGGTEGGE
ncbi:MAG TPA: hypothetical protein VD838_02115, partial [Anaeromyxobacteraceae bacterium]|nr:hypothetical protein [Anaeromyxobacteraceae bacterium]